MALPGRTESQARKVPRVSECPLILVSSIHPCPRPHTVLISTPLLVWKRFQTAGSGRRSRPREAGGCSALFILGGRNDGQVESEVARRGLFPRAKHGRGDRCGG